MTNKNYILLFALPIIAIGYAVIKVDMGMAVKGILYFIMLALMVVLVYFNHKDKKLIESSSGIKKANIFIELAACALLAVVVFIKMTE